MMYTYIVIGFLFVFFTVLFPAMLKALVNYLIITPYREKRLREFERLREFDRTQEQIVSIKVPKKDVKQTKQTALVFSVAPKNNQSCPLCWGVIDSCVWYCSDCKTLYHVDCMEEMSPRYCPTTGCDNRFFELKSFQEKA